MSDTYTKLFSSITESTVWGEEYATRIVWVTLLAMSDARGNVYGSIPGIARRANVTLEEVEVAFTAFLSPDPYSRTQNDDGRRVRAIQGGWNLINHGKYSAVRNAQERQEYKREWDRNNRSKSAGNAQYDKSDSDPTDSDSSDRSDPTSTNTTTNTKEQEQKTLTRRAARFMDWWDAYPKKVGKKPAEKKWRNANLDEIADALIADVRFRATNDNGWLTGYVPDPLTYLNQERWNDDLRLAPTPQPGRTPIESKTLSGMKALQEMKS